MRLYIAEKPSVGRELARCLPAPQEKHDGFIVTGGGTVTWLFGHILRQAEPEEYGERFRRWRSEDLPIIPSSWRLVVDENSAKQFAVVKGLIGKADEIVHGGDPDREGQLLVDEVLDFLGNKKPVKRLLLNALDEKSIHEALSDLRDNKDFFNLKQSALARARADWLIGMNLSRAYTLAARRAGHKKLVLPIGRVKTPTLSLVVRREREIKDFKPVDYYNIRAVFKHANGSFTAQWKPRDTMAGLDSENRLIDKVAAERFLAAFLEEPREGKLSSYQKAKKQEPQPLPFALSSLQVLAGRRCGYSPQQVLDTAQKLYEKKLTTYPRSDCEYLPNNQLKDAPAILRNLSQSGDEALALWTQGADLKLKSRAWNDKKISAHHAIIPTTVRVNLASLSEMERNIYFLVARGYIAQFYGLHVYDQTKVEVSYHDETFTASGRTEREPGWKVLYQSKGKPEDEEKKEDDEAKSLPPMKKGDMVTLQKGAIKTSTTKPPTRFTPATLLAGMKEIHKYVKNPEAKKQLKDVYGIGTEATRAAIIDDLIKRKFLTATGKKKTLVPTESAYLLVDALPDEMTYPDSTAVWEDRLHSMAGGEGTLADFLAGQIDFTKRLCAKAGDASFAASDVPKCPRCQGGVLIKRKGKNGDFWGCSSFPRCRFTCDDKDGKPDIEGRLQRRPQRTGAAQPFDEGERGHAAADEPSFHFGVSAVPTAAQRVGEWGTMAADEPSFEIPSGRGAAPSAADLAEIDALYASGELDDFAAPPEDWGAPVSFHGWGDKPRYSASPMEKWRSEGSAEAAPQGEKSYTCPRCKTGHLRLTHGRNGVFWGCDRYPRCTATFNDQNGRPRLV